MVKEVLYIKCEACGLEFPADDRGKKLIRVHEDKEKKVAQESALLDESTKKHLKGLFLKRLIPDFFIESCGCKEFYKADENQIDFLLNNIRVSKKHLKVLRVRLGIVGGGIRTKTETAKFLGLKYGAVYGREYNLIRDFKESLGIIQGTRQLRGASRSAVLRTSPWKKEFLELAEKYSLNFGKRREALRV